LQGTLLSKGINNYSSYLPDAAFQADG